MVSPGHRYVSVALYVPDPALMVNNGPQFQDNRKLLQINAPSGTQP